MPVTGKHKVVNLFVEAKASIGNLPFGISAARAEEAGPIFAARILEKDKISLSWFMKEFLHQAAGKANKISMPEVWLSRLQIRYFLQRETFKFEAGVTGDLKKECLHIRKIEAVLDIECARTGKEWQISGKFIGKATVLSVSAKIELHFGAGGSKIKVKVGEDRDDISLQRILEEVGIQETDLAVNVNPMMKHIEITYDTGTGEFYLEAESGQTRTFFESSRSKTTRDWTFGTLEQTEVGISNIPVIGGSFMLQGEEQVKNTGIAVYGKESGMVKKAADKAGLEEMAEIAERKAVKDGDNPVNLSTGIKFTILKTSLQAVLQKNGADIKILAAPGNASANVGMSIGDVIKEIKILMGGETAEVGNLEEQITTAVSEMNQPDKPFDINKVVFYIRQAFLYYERKGDTKNMEYAFSLEVNCEDLMKNIDFINLESISLNLWTTRRSKIIEQMNMFDVEKYLEKYPID